MELTGFLCVGALIALLIWAIVSAVKTRDRTVKDHDQVEELLLRVRTLEAQMPVHIGKFSKRIETLESEILFLKSGKAPAQQSQPAPVASVSEPNIVVPAPAAPPTPAAAFLAAISPPRPPAATPPPFIAPEPKPAPVAAPPPVFAAKTKIEPEIKSATIAEPPPVAEKNSFEMRLGTYWLVRAGIVMLLTGLAFFANYAYHHVVPKLGPGGKISLLYLASGLLLGAGA
jgi:uncharacterized membrane protein